MAEDKKDNLQDGWENDNDFLIANDAQIADMQKEYASLGVCGINESSLCTYPLPVYMTDNCFEFCKNGKEMLVIFDGLDSLFVSRNKTIIDFLTKSISKNIVDVALKGNITQDIYLSAQRMPIKQSMYRLVELHNLMSMSLDKLSIYDKSVKMQEVITRHLLLGSVLHGICI